MEPALTGLIIVPAVIGKYFSLLANDAILCHNGKGQGRKMRGRYWTIWETKLVVMGIWKVCLLFYGR